jgi:hypothetical protein
MNDSALYTISGFITENFFASSNQYKVYAIYSAASQFTSTDYSQKHGDELLRLEAVLDVADADEYV